MNTNRTSLLLLLVLVVATNSCSGAFSRISSYLHRPSRREFFQQEYEWIRQQVAMREGLDPEQLAVHFFEQEATATESNYQGDKFALKDALGELVALTIELGASSPKLCSNNMIRHFLGIVQQVYGLDDFIDYVMVDLEPDHDRTLFRFLKNFGSIKFLSCMRLERDVDRMFEQVDPSIEENFDRLIRANSRRKPKNIREMVKAAESFDLVSGAYDAKKMTKKIGKPRIDLAKRISLAEHLSRHFGNSCARILSPFKTAFSCYNLARALVPEQVAMIKVSMRFRKFNEYYRICSAFKDPDQHKQIKAKFKRDLKRWF